VTISRRALDQQKLEFKSRQQAQAEMLSVEQVLQRLSARKTQTPTHSAGQQ
jgi:hypothetical protein